MGFLDNSGDIILDAVLTDLGRKRLAEGNGKFRIDKFAFGDDEIDYGLYDKNNTSGSAYYDLSILQTPVLEAFTNNMSSMKSRLISYTSNDLLYLPVIEIFTAAGDSDMASITAASKTYIVAVDSSTVTAVATEGGNALGTGILNGNSPGMGTTRVATDQGLNTSALSSAEVIDPTLLETQYFVQIDNRLGFIRPAGTSESSAFKAVSIDDDNIATYIFTMDDDSNVVTDIASEAESQILGPRGSRVTFKIGASLDLKTNMFLFNQLGSQGTIDVVGGQTLAAADYKFIDSTVRVSGVSTGYTVDVPVRFIKKTT